MPYDYYCTNCARKLNNSKVLFDMQALLTGSTAEEAKFRILSFRMTEEKLLGLIQGKKPDSRNRYACEMTFVRLMSYIAGPHNLNDPAIASLTLENVKNFLDKESGLKQQAQETEEEEEDDVFGDSFSSVDDEPEPAFGEVFAGIGDDLPEDENLEPLAIEKLLEKDTTTDSSVFTRTRLADDLRILQRDFINGGIFRFEISPVYYEDDRGGKVLCGVNAFVSNGSIPMDNNRICPYCGKSIFKKAGTARHKSVVFIGYQSSGKTSTILSLSHYANNHMQNNMGDSVWRNAFTLSDYISEIEPLSQTSRLKEELSYYAMGIAPQKTNVNKRDDAYSSTFYIKSESHGKTVSQILTFTDLPGELCKVGGDLNTQAIFDTFAVATACDAFVVCLDTSTVENASTGEAVRNLVVDEDGNLVQRTPTEIINDTCRWADGFQKMLLNCGTQPKYVPAMLLFTKCRQIENAEGNAAAAPSAPGVAFNDPVSEVYTFRDEQKAIKANHFYSVACDKFTTQGNLPTAYHAMLRCSPYGYKAPSADEVTGKIKKDPELSGKFAEIKSQNTRLNDGSALLMMMQQNPGVLSGTIRDAQPHNIDRLMRWILQVEGCVPVDAEYRPIRGAQDMLPLKGYYVDRPQHREENPKTPTGHETEEAMARCYLFNNPGQYDRTLLQYYNQKARRAVALAKANLNPDSNARA